MKDNNILSCWKGECSAEKKNEMNRHVLEILDKCGIERQ